MLWRILLILYQLIMESIEQGGVQLSIKLNSLIMFTLFMLADILKFSLGVRG